MKCLSCGAELGEDILICPYCGAENEAKAREQHEEEIEAIYDKIDDLEHLEDTVVTKANRSVGKLAMIVIAGIAVILLAVYLASLAISQTALGRQQKQLNRLESYYQAGEYQKVADYYNELDVHSASFGKYEQTANAMRWREYALSYIGEEIHYFHFFEPEDYMEFRESIADNLTFDLNNIFWALYMLWCMEDAGYVYNEQAVVEAVREELFSVLKEHYLLDGATLTDEIAMQADPELDRHEYQELALQVADRIWENRQDEIKQAREEFSK